jgi:hypothetical protein
MGYGTKTVIKMVPEISVRRGALRITPYLRKNSF